ncbi:MAG TPA: molybdopterin-dependent oxidoreductase [Nocardioides sp.]|nr:molybdopterin-dependent oxidoreductase [Nocardioides sp.]
MKLPPGQLRIDDFPRFGLGGRPPAPPSEHEIEISGVMDEPIAVPVSELATMPRRSLTADFHCVSGWTATGVHWQGVAFADLYDAVVRPRLASDSGVTHVVLEGLDGYRSVAWLEDLLDRDVLVADRLDGRPLESDHGAPARIVSPAQYGYISTKHLARIELHTSEPRVRYHPSRRSHLRLQLVKPHPRARVWHEERHRYLPGRLVRPVYHRLIKLIRTRNAATPG